jgi:hypothetical protein
MDSLVRLHIEYCVYCNGKHGLNKKMTLADHLGLLKIKMLDGGFGFGDHAVEGLPVANGQVGQHFAVELDGSFL